MYTVAAYGMNCAVVAKAAGGGIDGLMEDAVCCLMIDITEIQPNADDDDATLGNAEMI